MVLDVLMQVRRNKAAAMRLLRKLVRTLGFAPETITTDTLGAYSAALHQLRFSTRHEQGKRCNDRAENSHYPTQHGGSTFPQFGTALSPGAS